MVSVCRVVFNCPPDVPVRCQTQQLPIFTFVTCGEAYMKSETGNCSADKTDLVHNEVYLV